MADFDKNFKYESIHKDDMKVYDIEDAPFKMYGIMKPEGDDDFIRMPRDVAKSVSEGVAGLNRNTAGGRVRFKTNSKYIAGLDMSVFVYDYDHNAPSVEHLKNIISRLEKIHGAFSVERMNQ